MLLLLMYSVMVTSTNCQQGAQYLHSAVRDLRNLNHIQTLRRVDEATLTSQQIVQNMEVQPSARRVQHGRDVPPLGLTKGELAALYQSAVHKGETLKLDTGDDSYIHAAVHEIDDSEPTHYETHPHDADSDYSYKNPHHSAETTDDDNAGYYYYYYPIKAFVDELSSQPSSSAEYTYKPKKPKPTTTLRPHYQFHSHHHQHNITINKAAMEDMKKGKNALEPLFMAISGFIGMAVMFVLSVLVLPKFSSKPNKTKLLPLKKNDNDFEDFARLAIDAIENRECAEKFACELSKTARTFNLQDNRFIKLLKRMAPGTFGKHINRVEKYRNKQLQCTAIPCKKRSSSNNKNNQINNPQKIVKKKH